MGGAWSVSGDYFESCNCEVACPCVFLSDPTHGECTVLVAWHVKKGRAGDVGLDGLNMALAAHTPGNMMQTKWEVALYIDAKADARQREALQAILSGTAGGPLAALSPLVGKVLGVKQVPMEFKAEGKKRSLRMPGTGEMSSEGISGPQGGDVKIVGPPLALVPEFMVAKASRLSLLDHGWHWDSRGGNSFYAPFEMKGP